MGIGKYGIPIDTTPHIRSGYRRAKGYAGNVPKSFPTKKALRQRK
jgi:hypothetical protein